MDVLKRTGRLISCSGLCGIYRALIIILHFAFLHLQSERRIILVEADDNINIGDDNARVVPVCKMCYNEQVECVFLPCGDAKSCEGCARQVFNSGRPCPFCDETLAVIHSIYL